MIKVARMSRRLKKLSKVPFISEDVSDAWHLRFEAVEERFFVFSIGKLDHFFGSFEQLTGIIIQHTVRVISFREFFPMLPEVFDSGIPLGVR